MLICVQIACVPNKLDLDSYSHMSGNASRSYAAEPRLVWTNTLSAAALYRNSFISLFYPMMRRSLLVLREVT